MFLKDYASIFIVLTCYTECGTLSETELVDYCIDAGFYAECAVGKILMMQEATYGRMQFGKCLQFDIGLNCESDVLPYMDGWCSGKRMCEVEVRLFFILTKECPAELAGYLRARYACIPVAHLGEACCNSQEDAVYTVINGSYIITMKQDISCPNKECTATLHARIGQQLIISAYYFNSSGSSVNIQGVNYRNTDCFAFINIREEGISIRVALCMADIRKRHLYTSFTNEVTISLETEEEDVGVQYTIEVEALGCPDPVPPENGDVMRDGDHASVKCHDHNDVMWEIICRDNNWHGQLGNCSHGVPEVITKEDGDDQKHLLFDPVLAIVVILVFTLVISAVIISVGILCIRRNRRRQGSPTLVRTTPKKPMTTKMTPFHSTELLGPRSLTDRTRNVVDFESVLPLQHIRPHSDFPGHHVVDKPMAYFTDSPEPNCCTKEPKHENYLHENTAPSAYLT